MNKKLNVKRGKTALASESQLIGHHHLHVHQGVASVNPGCTHLGCLFCPWWEVCSRWLISFALTLMFLHLPSSFSLKISKIKIKEGERLNIDFLHLNMVNLYPVSFSCTT